MPGYDELYEEYCARHGEWFSCSQCLREAEVRTRDQRVRQRRRDALDRTTFHRTPIRHPKVLEQK